jgi:hypothetical protein
MEQEEILVQRAMSGDAGGATVGTLARGLG